MEQSKKHIHIVGICGVATSALAIAFHKKGWIVSGSDKGFYPPVSTALENATISFYAGWHPEKMISAEMGGAPDFVIAGGSGTSPSNPELVYACEHKLPVLSFAEAIGKFFIRKNSIVTVGTWGKTTTSAMLSFILLQSEMNPSYFTGGISLSHDTGEISDSDWSIVEGDEYKAAIWDPKPKFAYYSPTHLLLTSVSWDHADLYPTEKSYFDEFKKLVATVPKNGLIVACSNDIGVKEVIPEAMCPVVTYGKDGKSNYFYHSISHTKKGITFSIEKNIDGKKETFAVSSPMLGRFNAENIAGCFAMACEIGIEPKKIISAIAKFKGIKRRLEKRFEGEVTLLDCHAPTAEKAQSVLHSIREVYDKKIIAVFEPNIGGRQKESIAKYDNALSDADMIIIPRLTKLKISEEIEKPLEGNELADYISKTHKKVLYIEDDKALVEKIIKEAKAGDVIAFLGSHGFRGMIEETVEKLK
jgi:UDP-N-acetylmuramate: L-alanyl-gamma-D-glutamyl-meso-diaminopimelate ligase